MVSPGRAKQPFGLGSLLEEHLPEVEAAARIQSPYTPLMVHGQTRLYQPVHVVDGDILQVLDIPLLRGDRGAEGTSARRVENSVRQESLDGEDS